MKNYIELLPHDTKKIKHPVTGEPVRLYRIISNRTFRISRPDIGNNNRSNIASLTESIDIERYELGGYVQSLDNIDQSSPVWIDHEGKVFDKAIISNGTIVADKALVFENSIIDNSYVSDYAKVFGNVNVKDSWIGDMTTVKDDVVITGSKILNSSMIYDRAKLTKMLVTGGCYINGDAIVENTILKDYSMIGGKSKVHNVTLSGRASIVNKDVSNETIDLQAKLNIERFED